MPNPPNPRRQLLYTLRLASIQIITLYKTWDVRGVLGRDPSELPENQPDAIQAAIADLIQIQRILGGAIKDLKAEAERVGVGR
jgi:hypothetical protein